MKRSLTLLLFAALLGCNNVPTGTLTDSFTARVTRTTENDQPIQVDFLWVIDNSASMCQEQASLAASFDTFLGRLKDFVALDYRIGVVTTDVLTQDSAGLFRHHKKEEFPFACHESRIYPCYQLANGDDVCAGEMAKVDSVRPGFASINPTSWKCKSPSEEKQNTNCNGTYNSDCKRRCVTDAECDAEFVGKDQGEACAADSGKCRYKCLKPSGDPNNTGCVLRPDTKDCPGTDELFSQMETNGVPFLTNNNAAQLFKCVATVGAEQHNNANLESGLNAAILALDAEREPGLDENHRQRLIHQARTFLRPDAYLVIVFISDEDDCSLDSGRTLGGGEFGKCVCIPDTDSANESYPNGGLMRPVRDAVNRIKSLKSDPARVLVASIVGDSLAGDEATAEADRMSYYGSKCALKPPCTDTQIHPSLSNTYICNSGPGKADFGRRYFEFVERFGLNGIVTNICSDEGVAPALEQIADRVIKVFTKLCLPRPFASEESIFVRKIGPEGVCGDGSACSVTPGAPGCSDGGACKLTETVLQQGTEQGTETYQLVSSSDCVGTDAQKAVFFNFLLPVGTKVEVDYQALLGGTATVASKIITP